MAADPYRLEDAELDVATLIGQSDRMSEVITKNDSTDPPNIPAAGIIHYSMTGQHKYASPDGNAYNTGNLHLTGAPAQVINTLTASNPVTGASCPVKAGTYIIDGVLFCTQGAVTAQQAAGISVANASSMLAGFEAIDTTAGSAVVAWGAFTLAASGRGSLGAVGNITSTHTFMIRIRGHVIFSAADTLIFTASCVTLAADTWTVNAFDIDISPAT